MGTSTPSSPKRVSLALQGGGSRGAYVWGVLDRLLEDERIEIEGVSGTSSGAVNGTLLVHGLNHGGPDAARTLLERFWHGISDACLPRPRRAAALARLVRWSSVRDFSADRLRRLMSWLLLPYEFDPATMEPLRGVIARCVDFEQLRAGGLTRLFINATNVRTNKIEVFAAGEITLDAVCASACLPFLFEPVEIEGEYYWDGAYMGNPAIFPLIYHCQASDIVLIESGTSYCAELPQSASRLVERISEVSFMSTLVREMRTIAFISQLLRSGQIARESGMREIRMHMVPSQPLPALEAAGGRFEVAWPVLTALRDAGRHGAELWLARNYEALGEASTLDIEELYL